VAAGNEPSVPAQELTNVVWSYAQLGAAPSPGFLADVAAVSLKQIAMFKAQELSSLLWAFAVFGFHPGDPLMAAAAGESFRQVCPLVVMLPRWP